MICDVHSHVLPAIDDGARSLSHSCELLSAMAARGVKCLALTPHYDAALAPMDEFVRERAKAFARLAETPEAQGMTLTLGAEFYLNDTIFNYEDITPLCYEGTKLVLTELEFGDTFTRTAQKRLLRFAEAFGVTPVLAHVDRYPFFRDLRLLEELWEMGCLFQWNLSSCLGFFGRRRFFRAFDRGLVHFLGGDVHRALIEEKKSQKGTDKIRAGRPALLDTVNALATEKIFFTKA